MRRRWPTVGPGPLWRHVLRALAGREVDAGGAEVVRRLIVDVHLGVGGRREVALRQVLVLLVHPLLHHAATAAELAVHEWRALVAAGGAATAAHGRHRVHAAHRRAVGAAEHAALGVRRQALKQQQTAMTGGYSEYADSPTAATNNDVSETRLSLATHL